MAPHNVLSLPSTAGFGLQSAATVCSLASSESSAQDEMALIYNALIRTRKQESDRMRANAMSHTAGWQNTSCLTAGSIRLDNSV